MRHALQHGFARLAPMLLLASGCGFFEANHTSNHDHDTDASTTNDGGSGPGEAGVIVDMNPDAGDMTPGTAGHGGGSGGGAAMPPDAGVDAGPIDSGPASRACSCATANTTTAWCSTTYRTTS
jgi:hypothetical protein